MHLTVRREGYGRSYEAEPVHLTGGIFIPAVGPGEQLDTALPLEDWHHEFLIASGGLPVEVSFTDSNGENWTRNVDGVLDHRAEALGGFC